jgi:hypothetical protein
MGDESLELLQDPHSIRHVLGRLFDGPAAIEPVIVDAFRRDKHRADHHLRGRGGAGCEPHDLVALDCELVGPSRSSPTLGDWISIRAIILDEQTRGVQTSTSLAGSGG